MEYLDKWSDELNIIAAIIAKTPLEKSIKWGAEVFTYKGSNIVSYSGFKNYFAVWFYNGVFLKDSYKVLVNAQEGKTKSLRQWRFSNIEEIDEKKILEYIYEAIENEENGIKIKPEKFLPVPIPEIFQEYLENDDNLNNAFRKLTPGRQKEYNLYIDEAKQESSKLRRIEKIIPMILSGIGLNDKYKKNNNSV
jgi:uncharacterized protein YdeI (YjbR/CyaY-like superfamily)